MPGINLTEDSDPYTLFNTIKQVRQSQKTSDLCFDETEALTEFREEIIHYGFKDKPDYNKLRAILEELRDINKTKSLIKIR